MAKVQLQKFKNEFAKCHIEKLNMDQKWINKLIEFWFIFLLSHSLYYIFTICLQGLRWAALCGAFGTCIGSWIKVASVQEDLFYVTFMGQSVVAASQVNNFVQF